jgi:hypothetical protein
MVHDLSTYVPPTTPEIQLGTISSTSSTTMTLATLDPIELPSDLESLTTAIAVKSGRYQCETCEKRYLRQSRRDACQNRHKNTRPYFCGGGCGEEDWYVHRHYFPLSFNHAATASFALICLLTAMNSKKAYKSIEHLRRHWQPNTKRYKDCNKWCVN